jgi:hypothetical protein
MNAGAVLLLVVPLVAMVAGFVLALRLIGRAGAIPVDGYTAAGRRVLKAEVGARLVGVPGGSTILGTGSLLLTDGELVFERYFPRREFRVDLAEVASVSTGNVGAGILAVDDVGGEGLRLRVSDADAWVGAIRRAVASRPKGF